MLQDNAGGYRLTHHQAGPAESGSSSDAGGDGPIRANGPAMTGNDLSGRSLGQAQVQAVAQGVSSLRMPTGTGGASGVMHRREFCDAVLQQSESHATDAAGRSEGRKPRRSRPSAAQSDPINRSARKSGNHPCRPALPILSLGTIFTEFGLTTGEGVVYLTR